MSTAKDEARAAKRAEKVSRAKDAARMLTEEKAARDRSLVQAAAERMAREQADDS